MRTCATTTRSAQPSGTPVVSNVPSATLTRLSATVLANCARMPSTGSTARSSASASFQSGCASSARVKMPVPEPTLGAAARLCDQQTRARPGSNADVLEDVQRCGAPCSSPDVGEGFWAVRWASPGGTRPRVSLRDRRRQDLGLASRTHLSYNSFVPAPNPALAIWCTLAAILIDPGNRAFLREGSAQVVCDRSREANGRGASGISARRASRVINGRRGRAVVWCDQSGMS